MIMMGIVMIFAGFNMTSKSVERTFLCFDEGCITIQGYSCITLGLIMVIFGVYIRFLRFRKTK